jgi:predicted acylesterase/phospholipase RssA
MAVANRGDALHTFRELINNDPVKAEEVLLRPSYLPPGLEPSQDPFAMNPETLIGGYGQETSYALRAPDPSILPIIAGPPSDVLSGRPSITSETIEAYVKTSLDLTMEGGTTSGVVYPLAVCELATKFRFRNVGGASAGAIAAALTAAAELGRSSQLLASVDNDFHSDSANGFSTNGFRVHRGFTGLADIISWLAQTQIGDQEADEFRLAQLFRPANSTAAIFRVGVAIMRGRSWPLALLALFAFGWVPRLFTLALILGAIVLTGYLEWKFSGVPHSIPAIIALGALGVLAYVVTLVGLAFIGQGIRSAIASPTTKNIDAQSRLAQLRRFTSRYATPRSTTLRQLITGAVLIILVVLLGLFRPALYAAAVLVGFAASTVIAIGLLTSILIYIGRFKSHAFGLIPGATPQSQRSTPLDAMAGIPKPTVEKAVVPWLNDCLNALAGLPPDQVLRFGHLWSGVDHREDDLMMRPSEPTTWRLMSEDPDHRLVNLELMTTDLTRQRPFRFPLDATDDDDPEQLWVSIQELREAESPMFPESILQALERTESRTVQGRTLHKLPQPWDLPVIFAVRISMSLPALFQAIRLYRIRRSLPIQDDLGRTIDDRGKPLTLLSPHDSAQELWFSDGGITSNFPVHFFDNPLPRWPTVSLNLGIHPDDAPHQDVWLPQDWENLKVPVKTLGGSGLRFGQAIFNTAMSWRDSLQSDLPGYRNRIAQVRTNPGEGGANLFMPREIIASLALRGALAGARLRTRFSDDNQWDRFRWLRLRTALSNLETLRNSTYEHRGFYADALLTPAWLDDLKAKFGEQPSTERIRWYRPYPVFWPKAARLLNTFADGYRPSDDPENVMTYRTPQPQPVIRQVPRE